jgi:hypothetical protein
MRFAIIAVLCALSGCAQYGALSAGLRANGAEVADSAREAAQFTLCNAITVGAWTREYGRDEDKAEAWRVLCDVKKQTPKGSK